MFRTIVALSTALWASEALANDTPLYGPPPAWVQAAAIPDIPETKDGSPTQVLLADTQSRLGQDGDAFYSEVAFRILSPQGLAAAATLPVAWSPDTETLTIHHMAIIRGGRTIDLLDGGKKVTVIRREGRLELSMLDGRLTATVQPEGLQVGDIIDLAMTLERRDPVLQGRSQALSAMRFSGVAGRVRFRTIWPSGKPVTWRVTPGMPAPVVTHPDGGGELVIDRTGVRAPSPPAFAPGRFQDVGLLELSQFQSWAEVSALMAPLYAKASMLQPDSPIRAEAARIRAASSDPRKRAEAALRLVQDQIHYVALSMNFGGFVPADADTTWSRRFGDCKGKTALLLALLKEVGVEAQAELVNTGDGDGLGQRLPMLSFDHVLVRAVVDGKIYWLDGTRPDDRDLDDIPVPNFRWALPVQATGANLEKVEPKPLAIPAFESVKQIDASAGYDAPAKAHMEEIYRGDAASSWKTILNALGEADAQRRLKEYWRGQASWMEPRTVSFSYDDAKRVMKLLADGDGKLDWDHNQNVRDYTIGDSSLGFDQSFKREPGPNDDAPIGVPYPEFRRWTVTITLPSKGAGFSLRGPGDVDETVAGRHYVRTSKLEGGVVRMVAQVQTTASEFPFADAEKASVELRNLAARDVFIRGVGGASTEPLATDEDVLIAQPTNASGFSNRGMSFLARGDYGRAIGDFTSAARLEPREAKHLYNRGAARYANHDDAGALADFNEALRLNPKDGLAYAARADILIANGDSRRGFADFDQALAVAPTNGEILERRAVAYDQAGRFAEAIRDLDTLLARSPQPRRLYLLNERCFARAEWGQDLAAALADCDAALALAPGTPAILDSRGFVALRMGQYDKAIADYDAALRDDPRLAMSLYGRGLAKLRKGGSTESGKADLNAARTLSAGLDARFARYGLEAPPR